MERRGEERRKGEERSGEERRGEEMRGGGGVEEGEGRVEEGDGGGGGIVEGGGGGGAWFRNVIATGVGMVGCWKYVTTSHCRCRI